MKYRGKVGFVDTVDNNDGIWDDGITERIYRGDVLRNTKRKEAGESVNDNVNISNLLSIIADDYAYEHLYAITYAEWMGHRWNVTNIEIQRPRLILTLGGLYNGETLAAEHT